MQINPERFQTLSSYLMTKTGKTCAQSQEITGIPWILKKIAKVIC